MGQGTECVLPGRVLLKSSHSTVHQTGCLRLAGQSLVLVPADDCEAVSAKLMDQKADHLDSLLCFEGEGTAMAVVLDEDHVTPGRVLFEEVGVQLLDIRVLHPELVGWVKLRLAVPLKGRHSGEYRAGIEGEDLHQPSSSPATSQQFSQAFSPST